MAPVVPQGVPPGVPGSLGVPEFTVRGPDIRGAPAPTLAAAVFQRGVTEHSAGDPGNRGVPAASSGDPGLRGVPAPGGPGSLGAPEHDASGHKGDVVVPTMRLTNFPMSPRGPGARGAPVDASTPVQLRLPGPSCRLGPPGLRTPSSRPRRRMLSASPNSKTGV